MPALLDLQLLRTWEERLELEPTEIFYVHRSQVTNTYNRPYRLIGYAHETNIFYYDKKVNEATIVHELLHKRHPEWSERIVRLETIRLMDMIGGITGSQ